MTGPFDRSCSFNEGGGAFLCTNIIQWYLKDSGGRGRAISAFRPAQTCPPRQKQGIYQGFIFFRWTRLKQTAQALWRQAVGHGTSSTSKWSRQMLNKSRLYLPLLYSLLQDTVESFQNCYWPPKGEALVSSCGKKESLRSSLHRGRLAY